MNNYGTSIDATTTAYSAQGSAMREQRAYMDSYEYQMTVMKATASELALTMEDQLVGDAMYLVISVGTDLLEVLNSLFETFGVLPTIVGGAGTGLLLFSDKLGGAIGKIGGFISNSGMLSSVMGKLTGSVGGMTGAVTGLSTAGTLLVGGGLVVGITLIAVALEKLIQKWADTKRAQEDAKVAMEDALTAYNEQGQDISGLIDRYEELSVARKGSADSLSVEEEREYQDIINQISTILPSAVNHIDAQGEAHLQNADYIRKEVESMQALADENKKLIANNTPAILEQQSEAYKETNDLLETNGVYTYLAGEEVRKYSEKISKANELQESNNVIMQGVGKSYEWFLEKTNKLGKAQEELFEAQSNELSAQFRMKEVIQETTSVLGEQALAMLDSEGKMGNMTSSAEALIINFSSYQDSLLENAKTQEEWDLSTQKITETNLEFGEALGKVYDDLAEGLDGVDPSKAIESMDMLVNSLPEEFFSQSTQKMQSDLEALSSTVSTVASGAEIDVDSLVESLVNAGVESDVATSIVIDLGTAFENQSIKSAVAQEELSEYNEELVKTRDVATEAINPLEELFGFSSEELSSMQTRLQHLQLLQQEYGNTWSTMDSGQQSISDLATYFGQSEEFVIQNLDSIGKAFNALSGVSVEWSEKSQKNVWKFSDTVDEQTKTFLNQMLQQADGFSGFVQEFALNSGVVLESQEKMAERTAELKEKFDAFLQEPTDTTSYNNLINEITGQLNELDGTFAMVEDSAGNLKFVMADGTESEFLNSLNNQLGTAGLEVSQTYDDVSKLNTIVISGPSGDELLTLASLNSQAEAGDYAVNQLKETYNALKNETTSDEDRQTYIKVLQTQIDTFGQSLVTTKDEKGNLELAFAEGGSSPWLEQMNALIGETGWKLTETKDEAGNVKFALSDQSGNELFTSAQKTANDLKESVSGTSDQIDRLHGKLAGEGTGGAVGLNISTEKARGEIGSLDTKIDEVAGRNIDLKIDQASITSFNDVVTRLSEAKLEIGKTKGDLDSLKSDLALTGQNLETIMQNVGTISNATGALSTFIDKVREAKTELGLLYDSFANAQVNTSGITNSATVIADEANRIKNAFEEIKTKISEVNISIAVSTTNFNITPIANYRVGVQTNMALAIRSFSALALAVPQYMNTVNGALKFNSSGLVSYRTVLQSNLTSIGTNFELLSKRATNSLSEMSSRTTNIFVGMSTGLTRQSISLNTLVTRQFTEMSQNAVNRFLKASVDLARTAGQLKTSMSYQAGLLKRQFSDSISGMMNTSKRLFYDGATDMVNAASNLPSRIGRAITNNMSQATNSIQALADNMVKRFKTSLGIHSPSRVFYSLGGHVIDGLVNGLSEGNLQDLGKNVFDDFSSGAISTIDQIKSYMTFEPVTAGTFGAGFTKTSGFGPRKSPGGVGSTNHKGTDYGAPSGTPIRSNVSGTVVTSGYNNVRGNYIIIESGNGMRHLFQHNSKNFVQRGQTVGKGQTIGTVGSTGASTGPHLHYELHVNGVPVDPEKYLKGFRGFANGGFIDSKELAWHGEEGPEAIIPLIAQRRERGLDLWAETGEKLGLDEKFIKLLTSTKKRTSAFNSVASFAGLDGEAGSASGDANGTSGVIKPDYSSIARSLGLGNESMFSGLATDYNEMEALYKRDANEVSINRHTAMVTKANTELTALTEQTLKYRNALKEVTEQETRLRNAKQKELTDTVKRQAQIEKELSKLQNTSKHTEAQRKQYNALQQEFDQNTQSIYSLENEIRQLNIAMSDRQVEIYTDYIGQLTSGYQELRDVISETIEDMQFSLDKLTLTNENDVGGQLKIQYNILKETMKLESTLRNNMNSLQSEYNKAVSKYGKNSKQALLVKEELASVEDDYQASVLNTIKLEQEIEKAREDVATEGIESLKNYYKQTQTMTERAIDLERKSLEKAHENKMSLYDEEIAKIESVYDTRLKEMDAEEAESEYQKTISDLNTQRADLMSQISRASRDTTLEGKKRLADLQTELATVNEEVSTTQKDRQDELYREAIEAQKEQQIAEIELSKEKAEAEQTIALESLDKQLADAKKYSDDIINDESMWNSLMERFVAGDTTPLAEMMNEMQGEMARYMSGDYSGISMGYGELSDEDKALFSEETLLEISNLMFNASESMERFVSTANTSVQNIGNVGGQSYNAGQESTWSGSNLTTKGQTGPNITPPPAPKPIVSKPKADNRYYTIKRGDTLWDLAQKYYGNPYKWTTIANANKNPDPRRLQIGRKLLIPFKSGGATGDWVGDEGRLAILHKKELVLNEAQTSDILNVAKIVDKISGTIPKIKAQRANVTSREASTGETYIIDNLTMSLEGFTGTKEDARRAFDVMAKELKKKGK